jgi:hypothetical protein
MTDGPPKRLIKPVPEDLQETSRLLITACNRSILIRAVPDFGSGSNRKTGYFYKSGYGQNAAGFRFLAGFAKWRVKLLQCSVFELFSKNEC